MHGAHSGNDQRILETRESREDLTVVGPDVRIHDSGVHRTNPAACPGISFWITTAKVSKANGAP